MLDAVTRAVKERSNRAPEYDKYRDYEEGRHLAPYMTPAFRKRFDWVARNSRLNLCEMIRSSFTDLVQLTGWEGDRAEAAQEHAAATGLARTVSLAVNESWRSGDAYILAWPDANGVMRGWYHRADQVYFTPDPERPGEMLTAVKLWVQGKYARANVYTRDRVHRYISTGVAKHAGQDYVTWETLAQENSWAPYEADGDPAEIPHSFGRVPWVHLPYDARTEGGHGRSILRDAIPVQDSINHAVYSLIVATESVADPVNLLFNYQAQVTVDPATGLPAEKPLKIDTTASKLVGVQGPGPVSQLAAPTPDGLIAIKRDGVKSMAQVVGLPETDISPEIGDVPSGAALRILSAKRTAKVRTYTADITPALSDLMGLLGFEGVTPSFSDPAPVDPSERYDEALKLLDLGLPFTEILRHLGKSQAEIDRIMEAKATEGAGLAAFGSQLLASPEVMGRGD